MLTYRLHVSTIVYKGQWFIKYIIIHDRYNTKHNDSNNEIALCRNSDGIDIMDNVCITYCRVFSINTSNRIKIVNLVNTNKIVQTSKLEFDIVKLTIQLTELHTI